MLRASTSIIFRSRQCGLRLRRLRLLELSATSSATCRSKKSAAVSLKVSRDCVTLVQKRRAVVLQDTCAKRLPCMVVMAALCICRGGVEAAWYYRCFGQRLNGFVVERFR